MYRARRHAMTFSALAVALLLTACGGDGADSGSPTDEDSGETAQEASDEPSEGATSSGTAAEAPLTDADGERVGTVTFSDATQGVQVSASLQGLEPGFHGFHLHETAACDPDAADGPFTSAGGHWAPEGRDHGEHAGDLPSLLVTDDGTAELTFWTQAFDLQEVTGDDGVSVMVHAGRDNFANVPDRYSSEEADEPGPDQETLDAGDAGDRVACGVPSEGASGSEATDDSAESSEESAGQEED